MRFGLFWQTPGSAESSVARRHWETIEEIVLGEQLGFETAWLAESVFYPTRPMSNPLMVAIAAAQRTERIRFGSRESRRGHSRRTHERLAVISLQRFFEKLACLGNNNDLGRVLKRYHGLCRRLAQARPVFAKAVQELSENHFARYDFVWTVFARSCGGFLVEIVARV